MKIFNFQRKNWEFKKAHLESSLEDIHNPGRGWYQIYSFRAENLPDCEYLRICLDESEKLVLIIINIGEYKNQKLNQSALSNIEKIISFFAKEKKDMILRFVYDDQGKGLEHEPFTLERIEDHMKTMEPLFRKYRSSLYIIQGLFIGSWGEMHTSKFLSEENLKHLYATMDSVTDAQTFLAVRRPMFWRMIKNSETEGKLGLFNDGMLATESHLGTYGVKSRGKAEWNEAWLPEDEMEFMERICKQVPHGGEVVYGELAERLSPKETIQILKRMHISYLNRMHDKRLINKWKTQTWKDGTLYEYIGAHLGYRFVIKNIEAKFPKGKDKAQIYLYVENTGFSNFYEENVTWIEVEMADGRKLCYQTDWDICQWESGETTQCKTEIPLREGNIYIKTVRKKDNAVICYAHKEMKDKVYLGKISSC